MFARSIIISALFLVAIATHADPQADAKALKDEALTILKANSNKAGTAEEYATCILKLEKAQSLLDVAKENDSPLAQEVSSSLFWARRFSNMDVLKALQKLRGGVVPTYKTSASTIAKQASSVDPPEIVRSRAADKAFAEAQSFATAKNGDDYAIALRWFQMAGEYAGTGAALRALELAREAQQRHLAQNSAAAGTTDPATPVAEAVPDIEDLKKGDSLVQGKQYEPAVKMYREALKKNDLAVVHRHLAKALYLHAQQIRDELKPKFEANARDYKAAYGSAFVSTTIGNVFNPDDPELVKVKRETDALRKEGDVANRAFEEAEHEFKAILKVAEKGRDFEAAAYMGLCQCVRPFFKTQGKTTLEGVIKDYTPANDVERTLYEFCKAEIERIRFGK